MGHPWGHKESDMTERLYTPLDHKHFFKKGKEKLWVLKKRTNIISGFIQVKPLKITQPPPLLTSIIITISLRKNVSSRKKFFRTESEKMIVLPWIPGLTKQATFHPYPITLFLFPSSPRRPWSWTMVHTSQDQYWGITATPLDSSIFSPQRNHWHKSAELCKTTSQPWFWEELELVLRHYSKWSQCQLGHFSPKIFLYGMSPSITEPNFSILSDISHKELSL